MTGIHGGKRVPKDDIRIEANGDLDELNCQIGIVRSMMRLSSEQDPTYQKWDGILRDIQENMMNVMSLVATPSEERDLNPNGLPADLVESCEATIDTLTEESGPGLYFLLPGGSPLAARLQMARAICRRAERHLWTLHRSDALPEEILQYINRLSDLFFVMARCDLARQEWPEERWKAFAYKNKR